MPGQEAPGLMQMHDFAGMVAAADRAQSRAQFEMDTILMLPGTIDEAALLFASEHDLDDFLVWATTDARLEHFNSVPKDTMVQLYGNSLAGIANQRGPDFDFDVRFEFLRIAGAKWRIEAMCVLGGTAPLHEKYLTRNGSGSVVHVSYKMPAPSQYDREKERLWEVMEMQAEYRNSYGTFSYWGDGSLPYLKPRVNTRDRG